MLLLFLSEVDISANNNFWYKKNTYATSLIKWLVCIYETLATIFSDSNVKCNKFFNFFVLSAFSTQVKTSNLTAPKYPWLTQNSLVYQICTLALLRKMIHLGWYCMCREIHLGMVNWLDNRVCLVEWSETLQIE